MPAQEEARRRRAFSTCVAAVVCAPWWCGSEKCPFDFGRTCVPEERTEERTDVWGSRIVLQIPKGMDACHQTPRAGVESGRAQILSEVAGRARGLSALLVRSLPCPMSEGRVRDSSRKTRGAIGACSDGASGGAGGSRNRGGGRREIPVEQRPIGFRRAVPRDDGVF